MNMTDTAPEATRAKHDDVDLKGLCSHCGGTHYGTGRECPYREENMGRPCTVCDERTNYCCSDCAIDIGGKIYVCTKDACRTEHEKKHPPSVPVPSEEEMREILAKVMHKNGWFVSCKGDDPRKIEVGLAMKAALAAMRELASRMGKS